MYEKGWRPTWKRDVVSLGSLSRKTPGHQYCSGLAAAWVMWPPATRREPGTCLSRPKAAIALCDRRSRDSMSHRGPIFAAGGRHSCFWADPTRFIESYFPLKIGRMVYTTFDCKYGSCITHITCGHWQQGTATVSGRKLLLLVLSRIKKLSHHFRREHGRPIRMRTQSHN